MFFFLNRTKFIKHTYLWDGLYCEREGSSQDLGQIILSLPCFRVVSLYKYNFQTSRVDWIRERENESEEER